METISDEGGGIGSSVIDGVDEIEIISEISAEPTEEMYSVMSTEEKVSYFGTKIETLFSYSLSSQLNIKVERNFSALHKPNLYQLMTFLGGGGPDRGQVGSKSGCWPSGCENVNVL